jgi:hypothetical protein
MSKSPRPSVRKLASFDIRSIPKEVTRTIPSPPPPLPARRLSNEGESGQGKQ